MPDLESELKRALDRAINRQLEAYSTQRGELLGLQAAPGNPLGAAAGVTTATAAGAGYNGTETVLPFTWEISVWNGDDRWTGS